MRFAMGRVYAVLPVVSSNPANARSTDGQCSSFGVLEKVARTPVTGPRQPRQERRWPGVLAIPAGPVTFEFFQSSCSRLSPARMVRRDSAHSSPYRG